MNRIQNYYWHILTAALFFLLGFGGAWLAGIPEIQGPMLVLFFIALGIGIRVNPNFRSFSYAIFIFAAVTVAMFYPQYLQKVGDFEFKLLIVPLLQIIMFGMGSQLSIGDFVNIIKEPRAVLVGVICQFTIMPVIAIMLTKVFNFPIEIAAGIVLVGSSPSGLASNVMSFLAKANVALSVTLTAIASLLAPIMTPFLMQSLVGRMIPVDFWNMMLGIMDMVILPIAAGFLFNLVAYGERGYKKIGIQVLVTAVIILLKNAVFLYTGDDPFLPVLNQFLMNLFWFLILPLLGAILFNRFTGGDRELLNKALALISMIGIGVIIMIITAAGRESLLQIGALLILACLFHNLSGYALGYWACKLLRLDERSCRTIALEVGMQNGGLASGIAVQMGKVATVGLAASVFGPMMNITGSSLAIWWRGREA